MWLPENVKRDIAAGVAEVTADELYVRYFAVPGTAGRAPAAGGLYPIGDGHVDTPRGRAYRPRP